jgi:hypothetical protein
MDARCCPFLCIRWLVDLLVHSLLHLLKHPFDV